MRLLDRIGKPLGLVTKATSSEQVNAARDEMVGPWRSNQPLWKPWDADMRPGRLPYSMLRQYADSCEPLRLCIDRVKTMIHNLAWDILPVDEEKPNEEQVAAAKAWFSYAGGIGRPGTMIEEFVDELVEDLFVCGCVALYPRPSKGRAAGLGGSHASVEPIDAATIIPLRDGKGWVPAPPEPAFRQVLRTGSFLKFTSEELIYRVWGARTTTAWGQSFVEASMMSVLQFQAADIYNLVWFTSGDSVLGYWKWTGLGEVTREELASFRVWLDKEQRRAQSKGKPLADLTPPPGWEYVPFRPRSEADYIATQKFLFSRIAPHFGLTPTALGLDAEAYKASQASIQEQAVTVGSSPIAKFLAAIFTVILQNVLGFDQVTFAFDTDIVDLIRIANAMKVAGTERVSLNESREKLGLPRMKGGYADDLFTVTATGQVLVLASNDPERQVVAVTPEPTPPTAGTEPAQGAAASTERGMPPAETATGKTANLDEAARADLSRWRTKVRRAQKDGKAPSGVRFISDSIPAVLQGEIRKSLTDGGDLEEVFGPHLQRRNVWAEDLERGLDGLTVQLEQMAD